MKLIAGRKKPTWVQLKVVGPTQEKFKRTLTRVELVAIAPRLFNDQRMTMGGGCLGCPCPPSSPNFGALGARWRGGERLRRLEVFCVPCGMRLFGCGKKRVALEGGELP
jgi:hypothetical protein